MTEVSVTEAVQLSTQTDTMTTQQESSSIIFVNETFYPRVPFTTSLTIHFDLCRYYLSSVKVLWEVCVLLDIR